MTTGTARDDWSAAILVGGAGRRLGGADKASLTVGGASILARQAAAVAACSIPLVLVTRRGHSLATHWPVVFDDHADRGPLGGLYTALSKATRGHVLVLAGDMPFITSPFVELLISNAEPDTCVIPLRHGQLHPLCAAYPVSAAKYLLGAILAERLTVRDVVATLACRILRDDEVEAIDPDGMSLFNVNTPDDLQRARHYAERCARSTPPSASADGVHSSAGSTV